MGIHSVLLPNNLTSVVLEWDTQSTCSRDTVSYIIAIDGVAVPSDSTIVLSNTSYIVSGLEANRMYTASVTTVISNCLSDQSTNITFQIIGQSELFSVVCYLIILIHLAMIIAPTPVVNTRFYCANSSDSITLALSWMVRNYTGCYLLLHVLH